MDNPYSWLQNAIDQVPEYLQPLVIALAAAVPYIEGEGASAFGIIAGVNPLVAAIAAVAGNILCVAVVVLLSSRVREGVVARTGSSKRREAGAVTTLEGEHPELGIDAGSEHRERTRERSDADAPQDAKLTRRAKGHQKLRRWSVRFGVPGASLLAPLALPTMLTAAFFVGLGVRKQWVILWQVIAIVLWTGATAIAATGLLAVLGW